MNISKLFFFITIVGKTIFIKTNNFDMFKHVLYNCFLTSYILGTNVRKFQKLTHYIVFSLILRYEQDAIFFYKMSYHKMMMCVKYSYNIYMY